MSPKEIVGHALPLKADHRIVYRDGETITIERKTGNLLLSNPLQVQWEQLLAARFRTPFDLNYTLRSLGCALAPNREG